MGEGAATAIAMTTSPREDGGKDGGKAAAALAEDRGEAAAAALADPSGPKFVAALVVGLLSMSIKLFAVIIREGGTLASCVGSEDDDKQRRERASVAHILTVSPSSYKIL